MSLCPSQRRFHTGRPSPYIIPPHFPSLLAPAALSPMHDENGKEPRISICRWTVTERQLAGVGAAALLFHTAGVRQVAAAAPPERHRAVGAVHAAERESGRVRGEVGLEEGSAA